IFIRGFARAGIFLCTILTTRNTPARLRLCAHFAGNLTVVTCQSRTLAAPPSSAN
ncbi:MAG: hypothetical protein AVDCRST_MAG95-776, partial [uncultured Adhaeribacter sp.]